MLVKDGEIFMRTGAGIVADSDPSYEFEETMTKVRALVEAIASAQEELD
jgi:anthranilate synthase component 1